MDWICLAENNITETTEKMDENNRCDNSLSIDSHNNSRKNSINTINETNKNSKRNHNNSIVYTDGISEDFSESIEVNVVNTMQSNCNDLEMINFKNKKCSTDFDSDEERSKKENDGSSFNFEVRKRNNTFVREFSDRDTMLIEKQVTHTDGNLEAIKSYRQLRGNTYYKKRKITSNQSLLKWPSIFKEPKEKDDTFLDLSQNSGEILILLSNFKEIGLSRVSLYNILSNKNFILQFQMNRCFHRLSYLYNAEFRNTALDDINLTGVKLDQVTMQELGIPYAKLLNENVVLEKNENVSHVRKLSSSKIKAFKNIKVIHRGKT